MISISNDNYNVILQEQPGFEIPSEMRGTLYQTLDQGDDYFYNGGIHHGGKEFVVISFASKAKAAELKAIHDASSMCLVSTEFGAYRAMMTGFSNVKGKVSLTIKTIGEG